MTWTKRRMTATVPCGRSGQRQGGWEELEKVPLHQTHTWLGAARRVTVVAASFCHRSHRGGSTELQGAASLHGCCWEPNGPGPIRSPRKAPVASEDAEPAAENLRAFSSQNFSFVWFGWGVHTWQCSGDQAVLRLEPRSAAGTQPALRPSSLALAGKLSNRSFPQGTSTLICFGAGVPATTVAAGLGLTAL